MQIAIIAAAGEPDFEAGEAGKWTGSEPTPGIFEVRRFTAAERGTRPHFVVTVGASTSSIGTAEALVTPIARKFAAAATAGQELSEDVTGLRPVSTGEAVSALALVNAMAGETKLVAQLPAVLPRMQRIAGVMGTGVSQPIAHALGAIPSRVFWFPRTIPAGGMTVDPGAHTATDAVLTITAGAIIDLYVDRFV